VQLRQSRLPGNLDPAAHHRPRILQHDLSSRATLSNALPAASSIVARSGVTGPGEVGNVEQAEVSAGSAAGGRRATGPAEATVRPLGVRPGPAVSR
jgi:hypothetical protein